MKLGTKQIGLDEAYQVAVDTGNNGGQRLLHSGLYRSTVCSAYLFDIVHLMNTNI